ncbi:hypothetical protein [Rhizobium leguminosarum]|uniref:hypothetical protein n=1 Tax=Rhizobium leguminosarum TaxID=384 RepID=UPI00144187D1|nr:hypothetical protein [Rhizobium leguminosarum]MBY5868780.1 hypothetical protein [Rhizobium leguminosarum]NKM06208.1 hypothetical protein [Rhizobium leguminosarum bv. viciae]
MKGFHMDYGMSARDYLTRAEECLRQNDPKYLFYAALELRCAVEARMREYLANWEHVSKNQKQGWEIAKLGRAAEKAFKGNKLMRWRVLNNATRETKIVLYYTPVTKNLEANTKRLGDYLHAPKDYHPEDDRWWAEFRNLLQEMMMQTKFATTGTLLGPALLKGNRAHLNMEVPPETDLTELQDIGALKTISVDFPDELPATLEPEAIVWKS